MALEKQLVHLNLTSGLQRKDDEKLVIPTKLTVADNVEFDDKNTIIRRGGQAQYGSGGSVAAVRMYDHNNGIHIEDRKGRHIRRLSNSTDYYFQATSPKNNLRVDSLTSRLQGLNPAGWNVPSGVAITAGGSFDVASTSTTGDGPYCIVWEEVTSAGRVVSKYSIRDTNDNELAAGSTSSSTTRNISKPRVLWDSTNSRFIILCASWLTSDTGFLVRGMALTTAGAVAVAEQTLLPIVGTVTTGSANLTDALFDAAIADGEGFTVAARAARVAPDCEVFIGLFTLGLALINSGSTGVIYQCNAITSAVTVSAGVMTGHAFYDNLTELEGSRMGEVGAVTSTAITTATFTGATGLKRSAVYFDGTNFVIAVDVYQNVFGALADGRVLGQNIMTVSTSHVLSTNSEVATACCIAGRMFDTTGDKVACLSLPLVFASKEYRRVLLILDVDTVLEERAAGATTSTPSFLARVAPGEIGDYCPGVGANVGNDLNQFGQNRVPAAYSSNIPFLRYDGNTRLAGTKDRTPTAICRLKLSAEGQLGDIDFNGLTYLAGAMPLVVDGPSIVEEGFHWAPEKAAVIIAAATGTGFYDFPAVATYNVCFTYAWEDAKGNWHESAPSATYTVTTTLGNLGLSSRIVTPPTQKQNAQLLMYRTLGDSTDTTFYLAHSQPLGAGVTMSEADLVNSEVLYTEGGVLPNEPMPGCRQLSVFQRRLVATGVDDGRKIFWSKQSSPGFAAEFSSDLAFQTLVPDAAGRVVGSVELDDKLIVVCESSVGLIYGQGPAVTGTQGQYSDFSTAVSEMGARWENPKSIIKEEAGVWFHSNAGLRLFSRSGGIARGQDGKHVGSDVDDLLGVWDSVVATAGVTSDETARTKQQVRFYVNDGAGTGTSLIWDVHWRQWTRFTGCLSVDARFVKGVYYHLSNVSTTPLLRYFSDSVYTDVNDAGTAAQAFTSTVTTGWLSFAGIQGFQRIYRLMLTGVNTTASAQTIAGTFTYDFSTTTGDSFTTNQTPNAASSIQVQHHMAKQKCEAMKISITFQPQTTANTGRLRLTDLTLQVGVKPGYFKLPSASRV